MHKTAFVAAALLASTVLLAGCTPSQQSVSPSGSPSASPSSSPAPSAPPKTNCDTGALNYLDGLATNAGIDQTRLSNPANSGYPKEIAVPDCAVQWSTKSNNLPGYAGLYFNATDSTFFSILQALKKVGITAEKSADIPAGMSDAYDIGLVSGGTVVEGGNLFFLKAGSSSEITTASVVFVWVHIVS